MFELAFAGLGSIFLHYGIGVGIIVVCILLEVFSSSIPVIGPFLVPFRKDLLWVAAATALLMFSYSYGVHDEKARCVAQSQVVQKTVTRAVTRAAKPAAGVRDKWDSDKP
jgi:hypothetical protein